MLKSLILTFINDHLLFYLNKTGSCPIFQQIYPNFFPILQKLLVTQIQLPLLSHKIWTIINQAIDNLMHVVQKGSPQAEYLFVTETFEKKNAAQWRVTRLNTRDNCIWNLPRQTIGKKPQQQADKVHLSESQKGKTKWNLRRTTSQSKNVANVFVTHLGW